MFKGPQELVKPVMRDQYFLKICDEHTTDYKFYELSLIEQSTCIVPLRYLLHLWPWTGVINCEVPLSPPASL